MKPLKHSQYIISELNIPPSKSKFTDTYNQYAKRILWLDDQVVEGAFHMNTAWYLNAAETLENTPHVHDADEVIGFFGNTPEAPYDLGGEIEFWLDDEQYVLTRSSLIFVPAGLRHCPLILRKVDRPIFHFTTIPKGTYNREETRPAL